MLDNFRKKIENKRGSQNLFWRALVFLKDFVFFKTWIPQKRFKEIYDKNFWGHGSGSGSLPENTAEYREFLENFIKEYKIKSILDAGCGDWQFSKLMDWSGTNYTGIDIVESVIEKNKKNYESKNIKFFKGSILDKNLPKADLIIVKDVLQHISNKNILKFLKKINGYKYALITNDFCRDNKDCADGSFRPLNLAAEPFNLNGKAVLFYRESDGAKNQKEIFLVKNNYE